MLRNTKNKHLIWLITVSNTFQDEDLDDHSLTATPYQLMPLSWCQKSAQSVLSFRDTVTIISSGISFHQGGTFCLGNTIERFVTD